jgi:sec-independent protein translocase protein TatA
MPLGGFELVMILVIVLIIFGAGKLPQVFGALGKGVREFRDASEGKEETPTTTTTTTASTAAPPVAPPVAAPTSQSTGETTQKPG